MNIHITFSGTKGQHYTFLQIIFHIDPDLVGVCEHCGSRSAKG